MPLSNALHAKRKERSRKPNTYQGTKKPLSTLEATDFALRSLHRLSIAAKIKNVPLYLWISPTPEDAVTTDYANKASTFLAELKKTEPYLQQIYGKIPLWSPDHFGTVTHLNPDSGKI